MSLWANYLKEREGKSVLEEPWGFIVYRCIAPVCTIDEIFVQEGKRQVGLASELADRVTRIAFAEGCTQLWAQVWVGAGGATEALRAILAYGFRLERAENGLIIMKKEIVGG